MCLLGRGLLGRSRRLTTSRMRRNGLLFGRGDLSRSRLAIGCRFGRVDGLLGRVAIRKRRVVSSGSLLFLDDFDGFLRVNQKKRRRTLGEAVLGSGSLGRGDFSPLALVVVLSVLVVVFSVLVVVFSVLVVDFSVLVVDFSVLAVALSVLVVDFSVLAVVFSVLAVPFTAYSNHTQQQQLIQQLWEVQLQAPNTLWKA